MFFEDIDMFDDDNLPAQQRNGMLSRLHDIRTDKDDSELKPQYRINMRQRPQTLEEMKDWLDKGYYKYNPPKDSNGKIDEDVMRSRYNSVFDWLKWEHPDLKTDERGYDKALIKLYRAEVETSDAIRFAPTIDEAFKALNKFKNETFH